MLKIIEYTGNTYYVGKSRIPRNDYIRFEWSTGYIDMKKYHWDRLPKKKRDLILSVK